MQRVVLIQRVSRSDKEFHFQNWVGARLDDASLRHDSIGRNSYPDFTLVDHIVVGYSFDLRTNELTPHLAPNPSAGKAHRFTAYRMRAEAALRSL